MLCNDELFHAMPMLDAIKAIITETLTNFTHYLEHLSVYTNSVLSQFSIRLSPACDILALSLLVMITASSLHQDCPNGFLAFIHV